MPHAKCSVDSKIWEKFKTMPHDKNLPDINMNVNLMLEFFLLDEAMQLWLKAKQKFYKLSINSLLL